MSKDEQKPPDFRNGCSRGKKKKGKKLLALAAVILFVLFFYSNPLGLLGSLAGGTDDESGLFGDEQLISEGVVQEEDLEEMQGSMFKSAFSSLEQVLLNSAYGAIDLSSDDEAENADLMLFQANSVVASNSPAPEGLFLDFNKDVTEYVVQSGDNPEQIAHSFGISTYTLLWANDLKDGDIIRPGQKLIILPINGVRIKVASGDTVASLAKKYKGEVEEILAFNSLEENQDLIAGEYLIIPGGETTAPIKQQIYYPSAPKYASAVKQANNWLIVPATGYNWGRIHAYNGVDVANKCGTPIYAAASGKVILSDGVGWNGGYGKYIKIQHSNGVITLYAHHSSNLVSAGEYVSQGQLIAYMGTTGRSTGCHLHFEVRGATNPLAR